MRTLRRKLVIGGLLAGVLIFGLHVRYNSPSKLVFSAEDEVRLLGTDAYYHLRHTRFAIEHFPHLQRIDVGTHYPVGQRSRAAGLYDLAMAAVALTLGLGDPSETTVDHVVAWAPAVLGTLAIFALFGLCRRVADAETGLLASAILSIYPGLFLGRTLLGFSDHHAAEVLLVLLAAWGAAASLKSTPTTRLRSWLSAFLHSLPMAMLLFTWVGGPIALAVIVLALFLTTLVVTARGAADLALAAAISRYGAALFVWLATVVLAWPDLVLASKTLKVFAVLVACIALVIPGILLLSRSVTAKGVKPGFIVLGVVLASAMGVWLIVRFFPGADWYLHLLLTPKTDFVYEQNPVTWNTYWLTLGVPGLLGLAAPFVCLLLAWRDGRYYPSLFVSTIGVIFIGMWLRIQDYDYFAASMSALLASLFVWGVLQLVSARSKSASADATSPRPSLKRDVAYVGIFLALFVPVWPIKAHPSPLPVPADVETLVYFNDGWAQAMAWMAAETPEPSIPVDARIEVDSGELDIAYPEGSYGVIVSWDFGNFVAAEGRRTPAASQGISARVSRWMLLNGDEQETLDFWQPHLDDGERFRYVVVDALTLSDHFATMVRTLDRDPLEFTNVEAGQLPTYNSDYFESIVARLYLGAGTGLGHYRLVYQSPHKTFLYYRLIDAGQIQFRLRSEPANSDEVLERYEQLRRAEVIRTPDGYVYGARLVPSIQIFEIVEGATLIGTLDPGTTVQATLLLRPESGGDIHRYRNSVQAGEDGRFSLTLPYATDSSSPSDVHAEGPYSIDVDLGDGLRPWLDVELTEEQVSAGIEFDLSRYIRGR